MKYQVIIILDETRNRSYYHSYIISDDTSKGNIECTELPPYADVNKAQACYWDTDNDAWVYDEEKYEEIIAEIEAEREAKEEAEAIAAAIPTNAELLEANMEIAELVSGISEAVAELGTVVADMDERITKIAQSLEG